MSQPRPGLGVRGFVKLAGLAPTTSLAQWFDTVRSHLGDVPTRSASPSEALSASVLAIEDYGFRYRAAAALEPWQRRDISKNVPRADLLLETRKGECRQTSLLVASTWRSLGWDAALIITRVHVVPALVTDGPCPPDEQAVEVSAWDEGPESRKCIWPLEVTFTEGDPYSVAKARQDGTQFAEDAMQLHGSLMVNLAGDVVWRSPVKPLFMAKGGK